MDIAASVASASAASSGLGGLRDVAALDGDLLNSSLYDGLSSSAAAAATGVGGRAAAAAAGGPPPSAFTAPHPLELQQKRYLHALEEQELRRAAASFGVHAALRLKTEREMCATTQRLPGLSSSLWGLQVVMGLDDQILAEDYLGREKPEVEGGPMLTVHERIERAMGI